MFAAYVSIIVSYLVIMSVSPVIVVVSSPPEADVRRVNKPSHTGLVCCLLFVS